MNVNIVGLSGSLRKNSYNLSTLRFIKENLPEGVNLDILDISLLPMFNEDLEKTNPKEVEMFKQKIKEADGIVIATPEYNYSIPPILKNALDWASRGEVKVLSGKPLAITSASPSLLGGVRVQSQLREICVSLDLRPLNKPEVFIMKAYEKFDDNGILIDDDTKNLILKLMHSLIDEIKK